MALERAAGLLAELEQLGWHSPQAAARLQAARRTEAAALRGLLRSRQQLFNALMDLGPDVPNAWQKAVERLAASLESSAPTASVKDEMPLEIDLTMTEV